MLILSVTENLSVNYTQKGYEKLMLLNFLMLLKFLENQGMSIYQKGSVVADMCSPNTGTLSTFVKSSHENTCHIKSASS